MFLIKALRKNALIKSRERKDKSHAIKNKDPTPDIGLQLFAWALQLNISEEFFFTSSKLPNQHDQALPQRLQQTCSIAW